MGIKTPSFHSKKFWITLKNLPTTWGLRHVSITSANSVGFSEKPPHHMGIKTLTCELWAIFAKPLKNLPTTWGLRQLYPVYHYGF